jgi:hypothetical protein
MSRAGDTAVFQDVLPSESALLGLPSSSCITTLLALQLCPSSAYPETLLVKNGAALVTRTTAEVAISRPVAVLMDCERFDEKMGRTRLIVSI